MPELHCFRGRRRPGETNLGGGQVRRRQELDGHSIPALQAAFQEAAATKGKPTAIIAHTIKGKGVSFKENNPKFHGTAPTEEEMEKALMELA